MARARNLVRWVAQGLISEAQADDIDDFEAGRTNDTGLKVFTRIGALSIAIGIISLVASNWDEIPPRLKLFLDLVVGVGLAWFAARKFLATPATTSEGSADSLSVAWREAAIVMTLGWTAASIALISQVFQLGGHALDAGLTVLIITTPLALYSRSRAFYVLWLLAWQGVLGGEAIRLIEEHLGDADIELLVALAPAIPLLLVGVASSLKQRHAALRTAAELIAVTEWLLAASFGTLFFYDSVPVEMEYWALGATVTAVTLIAVVVWRLRRLDGFSSRGRISVAVAAILCWCCIYLPVTAGIDDAGFLNALSFCALWLAVAWAAAALHWRRVVSLATHVVGLRLVIVYIELFADLLTTGIGLIISGALLLLTVRVWVKQRHRIGPWLGLPDDEVQP